MSYELQIQSFRDHDLNDATYKAYFPGAENENIFNGPAGGAVESPRPGNSPVHVRVQPDGQNLVIEVQILTISQSNVDTLKQWFSIYEDEGYLIVTDGDTVDRRILCAVTSVAMIESNVLRAYLRSASGLWEATTLHEDTEVITASGQTWDMPVGGTAPAYGKFLITPNTIMVHGNSYIHRRRVWIANRSPFEVGDPVGDGYPIDLAADAFDTATLTTAKMTASGNDLRVVLDGEEIYRWLDGMDTSTTKVWANLRFQPAKTFTLLAAMASGSSPAVGAEFEVSNPEGIAGWSDDVFVFIENEVLQLQKVDGFTWKVVRRGVGGTTAAAHSAAVTGYWIEHPWLDIIYDYTAAADPAPPDDRKPRIDLALSLNTEHHWTAGFINSNDRRSRAWQRRYTPDNAVAGFIRCYETGGTLVFEDAAPVAGKPRFNNVEIDCPIPQVASANAMELDRTIPIAIAERIYLTDQDGNESLLDAAICQEGIPAAETNKQFTPASPAFKARINAKHAAVVGILRETDSGDLQSNTPNAAGWVEAQTFQLDQAAKIDALVAQVGGLTNGEAVTLVIYQDDELTDGSTSTPPKAGVAFEDKTIAGSPGAARNFLVMPFANPPLVPSGAILAGLQYKTDSFDFYRTKYRAYARGSFRNKTATGDAWNYTGGNSGSILMLSKTTEPQADAPVESGDDLVIDNIELNYDTAYTPKIVMAAEETLYLHDFTITNNETGDWLHVFLPCRVGQGSVYIDCEARSIIDLESGLAVPFSAVASGPDWLPLTPGIANELQYDEAGLVSVNLAWSKQDKWL